MMDSSLQVLILAAGKGTRMRSARAKVLHEIFFAPMIVHVLEAVAPLAPAATTVVIGHQRHEVMEALKEYPLEFVVQEEQQGTAHAVLAAASNLSKRDGTLLILCGDTPVITSRTLEDLLTSHKRRGDKLSVLTSRVADPFGYGRIISDPDGRLRRIVEEKDATPEERRICEINSGIYCAEIDFLFPALNQVGSNNKQGEMYLTDIVEIAHRSALETHASHCPDTEELLGVNSRVDLARAQSLLQQRRNTELMLAGVTILQPETTLVDRRADIGQDTVIHPHVSISGPCRIGRECVIGSFNHLHACNLPDGSQIPPFR